MELTAMSGFYEMLGSHVSAASSGVWAWFAALTREEWVVVLFVVSALGFLCMLGYGSRSKY